MRRSARPSWRPRAGAGSSTNMRGATAMPIRAWCSMRSPRSRRRWRSSARLRRRPRTSGRRCWPRSAAPLAKPSRRRRPRSTALGLEESLAPIRKGARIIKEISWRWREIGADGRICDLLDSQVGAIEAGCETIAAADPRVALREAFDTIKASISAFSDIARSGACTGSHGGRRRARGDGRTRRALRPTKPNPMTRPCSIGSRSRWPRPIQMRSTTRSSHRSRRTTPPSRKCTSSRRSRRPSRCRWKRHRPRALPNRSSRSNPRRPSRPNPSRRSAPRSSRPAS